MFWNKKTLFTRKDHPRLHGGGHHTPYEKAKVKKRNHRLVFRAYLLTSAVAVILCFGLLFGAVLHPSPNSPLNRVISSLGTKIAELAFRGFSDARPPKNEGETEKEEEKEPPKAEPTPTPPSQDVVAKPTPPLTPELLYRFDYLSVPKGETPILPMDLSLSHYGVSYIHNATGLTPDVEALMSKPLGGGDGLEYMSSSTSPKVLILHTHGTEAYSKNGAISYREGDGELARSQDPSASVVAVGAVLARELNRQGIPTVHATVLHDREQYRNAYDRAEETIRKYRERYPSIELVIDVHRDSVIKSTGELVRPVTVLDGSAAAQVMCVVGSDWGGEANPHWEGNLALALKLRAEMDTACPNICRPVYLKSSTYNQELAPYSLLLEMGSAGNSLEEAIRSAYLVASSLAKIWAEL